MLKRIFNKLSDRLIEHFVRRTPGNEAQHAAMRATVRHHGLLKSFMAGARKKMLLPVVSGDGTKLWFDDKGRLHRDGAPAMIKPDSMEVWMQHGRMHRDEGPAVVVAGDSSRDEWWRDGRPWPEGKWAAERKYAEEASAAIAKAIAEQTRLQGDMSVRRPIVLMRSKMGN